MNEIKRNEADLILLEELLETDDPRCERLLLRIKRRMDALPPAREETEWTGREGSDELTCARCGWTHRVRIPRRYCPSCGAPAAGNADP